MNSYTLTVSPQGQITIPLELRQKLNLKAGAKVFVDLVNYLKSKAVILHPKPKSWVDELSGTGRGLWGANSQKYLEEERNSWQ